MFDWHMAVFFAGCVVLVIQGVRMARYWQKMPTTERRRETAFLCWYGLLLLSVSLSHRTHLTGLASCVDAAQIAAVIYWLAIGGATRKTPHNGAA